MFSFYSPVYEMLKKYLVVLGCSGKWLIHLILYTFFMWNNVSNVGASSKNKQCMNIFCTVGTFYFCDDMKFNCLFPLPFVFDEFDIWFASLTWYVLKWRSLGIWWLSYYHIPSVYSKISFLVTYIASAYDSLCICWGCGDQKNTIFQVVLQSHRRRP